MKVELDYKKGDRVIVNINGTYSVETITGRAALHTDEDGNATYVSYEINRPDTVYPTMRMDVDADCIYPNKECLILHLKNEITRLQAVSDSAAKDVNDALSLYQSVVNAPEFDI